MCRKNQTNYMATIRLTREFSFDMAHTLEGYDGLCRHVHGHSYRLLVTVSGLPCADASSPKYGMVMDFSTLKGIVERLIIARFDHALIVRDTGEDTQLLQRMEQKWEKVLRVNWQPTCENLIARFAQWIEPELPPEITLTELTLYETPRSFASWHRADQ